MEESRDFELIDEEEKNRWKGKIERAVQRTTKTSTPGPGGIGYRILKGHKEIRIRGKTDQPNC